MLSKPAAKKTGRASKEAKQWPSAFLGFFSAGSCVACLISGHFRPGLRFCVVLRAEGAYVLEKQNSNKNTCFFIGSKILVCDKIWGSELSFMKIQKGWVKFTLNSYEGRVNCFMNFH